MPYLLDLFVPFLTFSLLYNTSAFLFSPLHLPILGGYSWHWPSAGLHSHKVPYGTFATECVLVPEVEANLGLGCQFPEVRMLPPLETVACRKDRRLYLPQPAELPGQSILFSSQETSGCSLCTCMEYTETCLSKCSYTKKLLSGRI